MPLDGWDYVELWVGNAEQAAYFYRQALGFTPHGLRGPRDRRPRPRQLRARAGQGPLGAHRAAAAEGDIADHCAATATASRTSRSRSRDATAAYEAAVARARERAPTGSRRGRARLVDPPPVATFGDTVHTFVERARLHGLFWPGYVAGATTERRRRRAADHRPHRRQRRDRPDGRLGACSTRRCSGSPAASTSTTRTSRPSTRRCMSKVVRTARPDHDADQRARRRGPRARSRSISTTTAGPACSTSRCARTTSSRTVERCAAAAWSSSGPRRLLRRRSATRRRDRGGLRRSARLRHPRRPRRRRLSAADLHRDRSATGRRSSSRSSSATARHGFGEGNFKALFESIEREQARGGTSSHALLPPTRGRSPQAAHPVPRQRHAAHRGGDGTRGVHRQRVDPLPPPVAVPRDGARAVRADRAGRVGSPKRTHTGT